MRMQTAERLHRLVEQVWNRRLDQDVFLQLRQQVPVNRIPTGSLAEAEANASFARTKLQELEQISEAALTNDDWLTLAFIKDHLTTMAQSVDLWWTDFPVTPYTIYWASAYSSALFRPLRLDGQGALELYTKLMRDYATAIRTVHEKLVAQAARGWLVPQPALPGTLATLHRIRTAASAFFQAEAGRAGGQAEAIDRIRRTEIEPAFDALIESLGSDYQAKAPVGVGLGQFPGGPEAYRQWIRYNVSLDLEPERIHAIGLEEVQRLTEEMRRVREQFGFAGTETEFTGWLRASGRLHAKSPEAVEERYQYHMRRIEPLMPQYFSVLPKAPCAVQRLDPSLEAGMSYGYFEPPTAGRPTGLYYYNGSGLESRSQLQAAALIYHELVPGHHFQMARQRENDRLPTIRRETMDMVGYLEGWAEYAAGLTMEMGLADDPYDRYGYLIHQRFIAQRLVVDTGMNALGWTLERGRQYMSANTLESEAQVAAETLRYATDLPAQALAYQLGHSKLLELRRKAQHELGSAYDIRAFHEAVLDPGGLPLTVLEQQIDRFIEQGGRLR